jgi:hypothetical protein
VKHWESSPICTNCFACPLSPITNTTTSIDLHDNRGVETQGLLQFDDIFGGGSDQVPVGATILSAILTLQSTFENANGDPVHVHRMLADWWRSIGHGCLWDNFVNGIQADGIEARTNVDTVILTKDLTVPFTITLDVTAAVRAWANGEPNYGWVFLATGDDDYAFNNGTATGPRLEVSYAGASPALTIATQGNDLVVRWVSYSSWELVASASVEGPFAPVGGNPSGFYVMPPTDKTNPAAFFRLRYRNDK